MPAILGARGLAAVLFALASMPSVLTAETRRGIGTGGAGTRGYGFPAGARMKRAVTVPVACIAAIRSGLQVMPNRLRSTASSARSVTASALASTTSAVTVTGSAVPAASSVPSAVSRPSAVSAAHRTVRWICLGRDDAQCVRRLRLRPGQRAADHRSAGR
jgi:hypothetical protein